MYHKKINLALVFILFIQILTAQVTITIPAANNFIGGMTNAEWRKPFGSYDGYERTAFILTQNEIGQFGQINSIAFYCDTSIHNPGNTPVVVYMKETDSTAFVLPKTVATEENGAQMVYSGVIPSTAFAVHQWVTITFTTPFVHAANRSIEVIIETNAGGTGNENSLSKSFYHNVAGLYSSQYWGADNTPPTNLGTRSSNRPNVQFQMTTIPSCSGIPGAGTTISSVDTTCSQVSLSLQGNSAATGLTYQWQDSLSGGTWLDIAGATNSTLNTNISADTWFRCKVSCFSQSAYSLIKEVALKNYLQCYCTSNLGGGCGGGGAIDSVAIETTQLVTSHTGCSSNNYIQYPALANTCAPLASNQNYNLHTRFNGNVSASVWIDYDQNGQFGINEWKRICTSSKIDSDYVTVLNVPASAKTGLTLMRIRSRASGNSNDSTDACTNFGSGETEDYFIGINYPVGVSSTSNQERTVRVYPNPASTSLCVELKDAVNESVKYNLYSVNGALVSEADVVTGKTLNIDISGHEPGLYFLKVSGKDFSLVKKVVISR